MNTRFCLVCLCVTLVQPLQAQQALVLDFDVGPQASNPAQSKASSPSAQTPSGEKSSAKADLPPKKPSTSSLDKPATNSKNVLKADSRADSKVDAKSDAHKEHETIPSDLATGSANPVPNYLMASLPDKCGYSACNPPAQPQVAPGRCQPCITAIDCAINCNSRLTWRDMKPYPFQPLRHGEYLGPVRLPSSIDYRIRVGDRIRFVLVRSRELLVDQYRLRVNDELTIRSVTDESMKMGDLTTGVKIQPDGMIYLLLVGPVRAEGLTIPQLRRNLEVIYKDKLKSPAIDVQPIRTNTPLEDIIAAVDNRAGTGGTSFTDTVHPDGTVRLIKLGAVCVQGMTLDEVKREVNLRYASFVSGLEVEPVLDAEAAHFVFIYGEVTEPGRFQLLGPTSVTQALALAKGIRLGANTRQIAIFRRAEDWRMLATLVDLRGMHLAKVPTPADEIWIRDNDLIIVPPTPIKVFDNFVRQVFTEGIYGIFPFNGISITQFQGSGIATSN